MSADDTGSLGAVARTAPATSTLTETEPVSEERPRHGPGIYDRNVSQGTRLRAQRRTLIDTGALVFARHGRANASVAHVLEASRLSRGTFYRHFRSLGELFLAVERDAADVLCARLETAVASVTDPSDRLRRWIEAYLEFCSERTDLLRVLHLGAHSNGSNSSSMHRSMRTRIERLLRDGLVRAARQRLIREAPDAIAVEGFVGGVESVAVRYVDEQRQHELHEALEPLVRLACRVFVANTR